MTLDGTEPDDTSIVAYIDESRKPVRDRRTGRVAGTGEHYVVAAAVILAGDITPMRLSMVALAEETTGGKPIRWAVMSSARRKRAIEVVGAIEGFEYCLYETSKPTRSSDAFVRSRTLGAAFNSLSTERGVGHAILETRSQPKKGFTVHDERDHQLLASMLKKGKVHHGFRIEHRGKEEPILWIADILAGVRSDYLCWVDREIYPLIAHKAAEIVTAI